MQGVKEGFLDLGKEAGWKKTDGRFDPSLPFRCVKMRDYFLEKS